jgi:NAD(P)-dependent dehydrogenase (short-subunit alcohol dehydrogenase family)
MQSERIGGIEVKLEGKIAIITGGGTGIGRSIALEFAAAGADIVIASRRLAVLEKVVEEIRALDRRSLCVKTDVSEKDAVDNLVQKAVAEFGTIDILVNCASVGDVETQLLEISEDDWDRIVSINLKGYFLCSQAAGRRMVEWKKGNIINIASVAAIRPPSNGGIYNISKAGEVMLTLALARQLARYNIRVNAIAPGMIRTDMTMGVWSDPERLEALENWIPLGHMGEPRDIAKTALFLASDDSKHITGHTLVVDGGQLLK